MACCPPDPCCCTPCTTPFAQVMITTPPPVLAPTCPQPVKPLQLPCLPSSIPPPLTPEEAERGRYSNFYNYYNVDYRKESRVPDPNCYCPPQQAKKQRLCEDYTRRDDDCGPTPGCPTGFKPCKMELTAPPCCDPCGVWCARVQPCPPKYKKKSNVYVPGPCTRPCCKHWKPKEGPCLYDDPCKAHCYNHPPGIKPSGRFP